MRNKSILSIAAITILFVALFITSCEKDEIETIPLESVNGDVFELVNYGTKEFALEFKTDIETYPVTYLIRNSVSVSGNQISVQLFDIQKDGHDDLNVLKGSASCSVNLGALSNGQYDIQVDVVETSNNISLTISDDLVTISQQSSSNLTINRDTLNRIPFGTIWGYVGYTKTSNQGLANSFISGLDALGAQPTELEPGYYGYFNMLDSSKIVQPIDDNFTYYKEFIKDYQGDAAALNEHIGYYNTEFYNKVDVVIYWYWDGTKK